MKRYKIVLALLVGSLLLLSVCGQLCGNNPMGATGGGQDGYNISTNYDGGDIVVTGVAPTVPVEQPTTAPASE